MADCAAVCEHTHLPLQSGSTRRPQAHAAHVRPRALPGARRNAARRRSRISRSTTDIIVGFPGETEDDFRETLEVVEEVRYDSAFTFVFSPRPAPRRPTMAEQVPEEVKRERIERLVDVVQRIAPSETQERIGGVEEVLVEGPSRTDPDAPARAHAAEHDGELRGAAAPGELVPVRDRVARRRRRSQAPPQPSPHRHAFVTVPRTTRALSLRYARSGGRPAAGPPAGPA